MTDPNWMPPGRYGVNDAIASLRPGAMYQLENTNFKKWWHHSDPPSWPEILAESDRLKTEAYKQMRQEEYPPIGDFIDAYYWQTMGDLAPMQEYLSKVGEIKAKYPKPTPEQLNANVSVS